MSDSYERSAAERRGELMAPGMRWVFFWFLLTFYGISLILIVRLPSDRSWLLYLPLAVLTLAVACVAAVARRAYDASADKPATLMARLDLVPDGFVRCLHLVALAVLISALIGGWQRETGTTDFWSAGTFTGMGLLMLAMCCGPRPFRFRRRR